MSLECLFGTLVPSNTTSSNFTCQCFPYAITDFTLFHATTESCTLPIALFHTGNAFIVASTLAIALVATARVRQRTQPLHKRLTFGLLAAHQLCAMIGIIALWVAQSSNAWFWWFSNSGIVFTFILVIRSMDSFFAMNAAMFKITLPKSKINAAYALMMITGCIPLMVIFVGSVLTTTPQQYNTILVAFFFTLPLHELTAVPVLATIPRDLILALETTTKNMISVDHDKVAVIRRFTRTLNRFRFVLNVVMPSIVTPSCMSIAIVYLIVGFFPFQYLVILLMVSNFPLLGVIILWLNPVTNNSSSGTPSKQPQQQVRRDDFPDHDNVLSQIYAAPNIMKISAINSLPASISTIPVTRMQKSKFDRMTQFDVDDIGQEDEDSSPPLTLNQPAMTDFASVVRDAGTDALVVIDPDTADVCVYTKNSLQLSIKTTPLGLLGVSPSTLARARYLMSALKPGSFFQAIFPLLFSAPVIIILVLVLTGFAHPLFGLLYLFMTVPGSIGTFMVAVDWYAFRKHLVFTPFFIWRMLTILLSGALLIDVLSLDARAMVVPGVVMAQFLSFASDCNLPVAAGLRVGIVFGALGAVTAIFILMQFDLLPNAKVSVIPFPGFTFSLAQLCRDLHLFAAVLLLEELLFVLRRRSDRFGRIFRPCVKTTIPWSLEQRLAEENIDRGSITISDVRRSSKIEASRLAMASGFFALEGRNNGNVRRVWAGHILMKESSALVYVLWGNERGALIMRWLDSVAFKSLIGLVDAAVGIALILVMLGFNVDALSLVAIPSIFARMFHTLPRMHTSIFILLLKRLDLYLSLAFVTTWGILVGVSLGFDARFALVANAVVSYTLQLLNDANVHLASKDVFTSRLLVIGMILTLSVGLLVHGVPHTRPTTFVSGTQGISQVSTTPDDPSVWDLSQTSFDLGTSLCLHSLTLLIGQMRNLPVKNEDGSMSAIFHIVNLPVVPIDADVADTEQIVAVGSGQD